MADRNPHPQRIVDLAQRGMTAAVIRERKQCVVDACVLCRGAEGSGYARRPHRLVGGVWFHAHAPTPHAMTCRASDIYDRHVAAGGDVEQIMPEPRE